jgi:hypothetical protein
MGSGTTIYAPSFIKIGSGIQKLMGGYAHTQQRDFISLLYFFKTSKLGYIMNNINWNMQLQGHKPSPDLLSKKLEC